jgi:hypothetical protein
MLHLYQFIPFISDGYRRGIQTSFLYSVLITVKEPCKFAVNKLQNTNYSFLPVTSKVSCIQRKRGAPFFPNARTFHNIYILQKHVLLRHQSYLIVFMGNKNLRFWQIMPLYYGQRTMQVCS